MPHSPEDPSRRNFLREFGAGALGAMALAAGPSPAAQPEPAKPVSDRKVRMAIVGHGVCGFGASLGFQHHPNVQIVAVSDLVADRRSTLAKICACEKTYDSLEVLVKDPAIEAVCLATDAPSHARHAVEVLKHGKHCVTAVPAAMTLDDCQAVKEAKEKSGLKYMMAETSYYHGEVFCENSARALWGRWPSLPASRWRPRLIVRQPRSRPSPRQPNQSPAARSAWRSWATACAASGPRWASSIIPTSRSSP